MLEKQTIKKWFNRGIVAMGSGALFSLLVSYATRPGNFLQGQLWTSLALLWLGLTVAACGGIAASVAWWGAVFNTHLLEDKRWFNLLVWSGGVAAVTLPLFGLGALLGAGALVAYLVAGPDGMVEQTERSREARSSSAGIQPPTTVARTS